MKEVTRPVIVLEKTADSEIEKFQNLVLRSILKLQNDLLLRFFKQQAIEKKIVVEKLEPEKVKELVRNTLQKDMNFRSLMIGMVCGHFSELESDIYFQHKPEANRRIVTMMIERLCSQL